MYIRTYSYCNYYTDVALILQVKRFAQLPVLMEKLTITKTEEGQDLGFHLMVVILE